MGDPGPSSGQAPFIWRDTSNLISDSVPTQPAVIVALASTNAPAASLAFNSIRVTNPLPQANGVLSVRIETRIKLLVSFLPGSLIQFLEIPKTQSVKKRCDNIPKQSLKFSLELKGAGKQTIIERICPKCEKRVDQATCDIVDFRADTTIVAIENGAASFEFSIKCYPFHHSIKNFCADAILRGYQDNVINRIRLPLLFDIKGKAKQPAKPRKALARAVRRVSAQQRNNVAPGITPAVPLPAGDNRQTSDSILHLFSPPTSGNGGQQPFSVDTTTGIPPVVDPFLWDFSFLPDNAPLPTMTSTSQHAVGPSELGSNLNDMGFFHLADNPPLESNSNPHGIGTSASQNGEQILPVMPCEIASVPRVLEPTSGEPYGGSGINQSSRVPEVTPHTLSQNSSGIPPVLNTSSAVPSGQGCSAPGISIPPETSQPQVELPVNTHNEGITCDTLLQEVNPERGPITGGMRMVLFGENFPAVPLYVGFGDKWVRARWHDARVLRCCLPPSNCPGVVDVILSQAPSNNAPEVGWSTATFQYEESRVEALISILKNIYQWANETIRQLKPAQSFAAMNIVRDPNWNTGTTRSNNQERGEIPPSLEEEKVEDISIHFLRACSTHPNWKQAVSSRNEYGQTMAHICVTLGYIRLLQHLCMWPIDLDAVDHMGSTALHYAYLFQQEECAKLLIHSGVDQFILDDLGRSPSDLDPSLEVRIRSVMDMDSDGGADGASPIKCDTEMPDEAGKLYAKQPLIQQWTPQGKDERRSEVPLFKYQRQKTSSPEWKVPLERHYGVSSDQLDEQKPAYIRTEEFSKDDILARFGLDLGTGPQVDGSSQALWRNINKDLQPNSNPSTSILQRLAPAEGPVSGGPTILLSGINFPHPHQQIVYARFGAVVVPTIWHNAHTLECKLPPSPTPGTVNVTLSLYHEPGAPDFGQSHCSFSYHLELDYIHGLIRTMSGQDPTSTPENWDATIPLVVQKLSSAGRKILHEATQPSQ